MHAPIPSRFPDHPDEPVWESLVPRMIDAYIAEPDGLRARIDYALLWQYLALLQPEGFVADGQKLPPAGYAWRPDNAAQNAMLAGRAIAELDRLVADRIMGPEIFGARAELRIGFQQWDLAAADLSAALQMLPPDPQYDGWRATISGQLEAVRTVVAPRLDRRHRAAMTELAERVGRHAAKLVTPRPDYRCFAPGPLRLPLDPRALSLIAEMPALGYRQLYWAEDPRMVESHGERALVGKWVDAASTSVLAIEAIRRDPLLSITTRLSDDTIVHTLATRKRFHLEGGPRMDRLVVPIDDSLAAVHRIHAQRLRILSFDRPGVVPCLVETPDDALALVRFEWEIKREFRITTGKSELELRGTPSARPEAFNPLLLAASKRAISAAVAAETGSQAA